MMKLWDKWGAPVGNLIAAGIMVTSMLIVIAAVLAAVALVLRAWAYLMGA